MRPTEFAKANLHYLIRSMIRNIEEASKDKNLSTFTRNEAKRQLKKHRKECPYLYRTRNQTKRRVRMKKRGNKKRALTNAILTKELNALKIQVATFRKRWAKQQRRILNKYYSWQHYFTEKKRRFKARYKAVERKARAFEGTQKRLKRFHFLNASPDYKAKREKDKKYVLLLTRNDATRLKRFLRGKHYRYGHKEDQTFIYLSLQEKLKLRWLLKKDWRKER